MADKYNGAREALNLIGSKSGRRKKYKKIIQEMGARNISLQDIATDGKSRGFLDMVNTTNMTMDEVVVLQQYAKAIVDQDVKSATFLRDTAGETPKATVEIEGSENGLSSMSLSELQELAATLKALKSQNETDGDEQEGQE